MVDGVEGLFCEWLGVCGDGDLVVVVCLVDVLWS